jgi:hypothetical protein
MASQELLLMLILNVLDHKEAANVIYDVVLVLRVIIDSLLILSVVTDRVLKF